MYGRDRFVDAAAAALKGRWHGDDRRCIGLVRSSTGFRSPIHQPQHSATSHLFPYLLAQPEESALEIGQPTADINHVQPTISRLATWARQ